MRSEEGPTTASPDERDAILGMIEEGLREIREMVR
jgi:hypothetical protein